MFTGIVRDKGLVTQVVLADRGRPNSPRLTIQTKLPLHDLKTGASIACNGVCLTVCEARALDHNTSEFSVDVGPETCAVTRFAAIQKNMLVHLEPALRVGDQLGGHNVTGHVDGLARVLACQFMDGDASQTGFKKLLLEIPSQWSVYMLLKGSIAVAGVSLTIAQIRPHEEKPKAVVIEMMLIPHTLSETCLGDLQPGDTVEIECDAMAKMVASVVTRMLNNRE